MTAPEVTYDLPLSAKSLPPAHVERLQNALVVPMQIGPGMVHGVFRADGSFCQMSRTQISGARLTGIPAFDDQAFAETLPGRWLFAGIGRHHFGHFLVESLIRLWAAGYYRDELDGIVMVPRRGLDFGQAVERRFGPFLSILTDDLPVHLVDHPTRFETLLLPSPGFGPLAWLPGSPIFRREMRARVARAITPDGPEKLYISRTQLGKSDKLVDQEARLEDLMRKEGYEVFYPEQHSIPEQLARYRAAKIVVGADGSAFHLLPFAMQEGGYAAIYQRRYFNRAFKAYPSQLEAFAETTVTPISAIQPRPAGKPRKTDEAKIDFDKLKDELFDAGFLK